MTSRPRPTVATHTAQAIEVGVATEVGVARAVGVATVGRGLEVTRGQVWLRPKSKTKVLDQTLV